MNIWNNVTTFWNGTLYTHCDNLKVQADMLVVQSTGIHMQPDSEATQKVFKHALLQCHMPMQWILYTEQQRRKHKPYEAARLDGMCVTLKPGTML